jgi:uracil phosphoribosyltransferase
LSFSLSSIYDELIIYTLAVDEKLNDNFFIVPGLGYAGDRGLGVEP